MSKGYITIVWEDDTYTKKLFYGEDVTTWDLYEKWLKNEKGTEKMIVGSYCKSLLDRLQQFYPSSLKNP